MTQPTLLELIEDRSTRVRALEIAVIAHAIVDPAMIPRSVVIPLSEPAVFAVRVILGALNRASIVAQMYLTLSTDVLTAPTFAAEVMELTGAAAAVTVEELADAGSLHSIIKSLASERISAGDSTGERAA